MYTLTTRVVRWLLALSLGVCSAAQAAPQTGWWWNPAESGRGFFIESHDGVTFIGAYLYDTDGHALWLVAGGENADSYNYTGPLYTQSGGQTLFGSYVAPTAPASVGTITVHFSDDTHGTLTWPGGTVQIEREIFGTGDAPFQPDNGWWWNPDEGGSGYSLEVQGNNLFVVGFMYETSGRAVWYFSAGPMSTATTYHGDVLQFAGGQTMGGAYHPPGNPTKVATLDIAFTAENEATTTFTDTSGTAKIARTKASRGNQWHPQFPKPGKYVPPAKLGGYFTLNDIEHDARTPGLIYNAQHTVRLDFAWKAAGAIGPIQVGGLAQGYAIDYTTATITITFNATAVTEAGTCTQTGSLTLPMVTNVNGLSITTFRKYYLQIFVEIGDLLPVTQTCVFADGGSDTTTIVLPLAVDEFQYEGAVVRDTVEGGGTKTVSESNFTETQHYEWSWVGQ